MANWRLRLARALAGDEHFAPKDQGRGAADVNVALFDWATLFEPSSTKRLNIYNELEDMEDDVADVPNALDLLADEAVYGEGEELPVPIITVSGGGVAARRLLTHLQQRVLTQEALYKAARGCLLRGDKFIQPVVSADMLVTRLMTMPARSMYRQETPKGTLKRGNTPGKWAFEQRKKGMTKPLAGFYPWEIVHLRWRNDRERDGGLYGKGLFYAARPAWKKLQAMEEALVINWLTRAFARLLFMVDTTGMSDKEALKRVKKVREEVTQLKIAPDLMEQKLMSVVQDIFLGVGYHDFGGGRPEKGLTDVKSVDTASSGFTNLDPVKYYQRDIVRASRVPPVYLGYEEESATRNTLRAMDRRYARTVRLIQGLLTNVVTQVVGLQLVLHGANPATLVVTCKWHEPARADEQDRARTFYAYARGDEIYRKIGLTVDIKWLALKRYGVQPIGGWGEPEDEDGNGDDED